MFRKNTLNTKLATHLLEVGQCYKSDLYMVAKMLGDEAHGIKTINAMIKSNDIAIREVKSGQRRIEVFALTKKAKIELLNVLDDEYFYRHYKEFEQEFHTSNQETLKSRLDSSRVKTMFALAGVPTFQKDKPSLYHLFTTLYQLPYDYKEKFDNKPTYNDTLNAEECAKVLSAGIYYTIKEVRDFLNEDIEGSADTFLGSRAKGIFISTMNCLIVYSGKHGENKLIRIRQEAEKRLLSGIRPLLQITQVNRNLPALSRRRQSTFDGTKVVDKMIENTPYGLVITDGESLIYSMATGNPRGLVKGIDKNKYDKTRKKRIEEKGMSVSKAWLKGDGAIFQRLFATPFTENGIHSLDYICHTTAEEWHATSLKLFSSSKTFTPNNNNPLYPYDIDWETKIPMIYMPVFECNELYNIYQMDYKVGILTYPDMLNVISHSVRKELPYFDADTMERVNRDNVLIYDDYGYPKGLKMLQDYLLERNLETKKKDYFDLPKKFNYEYTKFYNEIARGKINLDKLFPSVPTTEIEIKEQKRIKRKSITLSFGEEMTNKIYQAAKLHNMSASAYVKSLIHDKVVTDAEAYKELIRKNRAEWKN